MITLGSQQRFKDRVILIRRREAIAAMDFFTVPTITFGALYCFFVVSHGRRGILHFNVTKRPTSLWVAQQLRWWNSPSATALRYCSPSLSDPEAGRVQAT